MIIVVMLLKHLKAKSQGLTSGKPMVKKGLIYLLIFLNILKFQLMR
jgi:hypothetical protein